MKRFTPSRVFALSAPGGILLILPLVAHAQQSGFVPLSRIPGVTDTTSIGEFFNAAFQLGLVAVAVLAVVMIAFGGIEYMTTDSLTKKSSGRERIQNAVIGLLLALLIWIILATINPNLLKFNFTPTPAGGLDSSAFSTEGGSGSTKGGGNFINPNGSYSAGSEQAKRQESFGDTPYTSECNYRDNMTRKICLQDIEAQKARERFNQ